MSNFKELYQADMHRYADGGSGRYLRKVCYYLRKLQTSSRKNPVRYYYVLRYISLCNKNGIQIPWNTSIGKGFYIGHPYNITINPDSVLGDNVNIHKGATIGQENRGKRKGAPKIGNKVYIGVNSTVVGNITVGDDVLIAANTFVNCDVPSHSIVIGSPCKIIHKDNATEGYINNIV